MLEFRTRRSRIWLHIVLIAMAVPFIYPFVSMLMEANQGSGFVENFRVVLARPEVAPFFLSSAIIAAGTIAISYVATMLAAYALANLRHRGKSLVTYVMVAALTLPTASLIVPLFYVVSKLGLYDNYGAVIIPLVALTIPFNIILTRSYLAALPYEFFEAASLDGCSTWQVFLHVVLPLSRPITAVVVVWTFVGAWNEFLLPLLFLQDPAKQTITLLPTFYTSQYGSDQSKVVAASLIALIPTVVIYLLVQRFFERGVVSGALK